METLSSTKTFLTAIKQIQTCFKSVILLGYTKKEVEKKLYFIVSGHCGTLQCCTLAVGYRELRLKDTCPE